MYDKDFKYIPFGISRMRTSTYGNFIGYADYRIFGIRVVRIQETKPWD